MANQASSSEKVRIVPCSCEHEYQDKKYGKGMRVHNRGGNPKSNTPTWVCTVCGKIR